MKNKYVNSKIQSINVLFNQHCTKNLLHNFKENDKENNK